MNFVLILFKLREEEINAEKIITVKNVTYCSYEKKAWKNSGLSGIWTACPLRYSGPRSLLLSQQLKTYATPLICFLVFVTVVVMVAYIIKSSYQ